MASTLDVNRLKNAATEFAESLRSRPIPELYGTTDGKALGTWVEASFNEFLAERYAYEPGNPARGIDFPELEVDLKATFIKQPQSSCPFRDAAQKIFGLGYDLLVFVYEKTDTHETQSAAIDVRHALFIDRSRTGDYQTTRGILEILDRDGNLDDLLAFMEDRNLPVDETGRTVLAERVLNDPPTQGYLTISNALQWRLQYGHAITNAGEDNGVEDLVS
ncbi:MAG: restriction endonuclease [Acidimicrobiia bacterium]